MLRIHEWTTENGSRDSVEIDEQSGSLVVHVGAGAGVALPMLVLARVMERYGKPLADGIALEGPRLEFTDGSVLVRIRHRARYDVIARDFLVWCAPDREPLAALAVAISGALEYLAKVPS